jgi:hypothetical protein
MLFSPASYAADSSGFKIITASTHLQENTFLLNADLYIRFTPVILEALENGVPITLNIDITVKRERNFIWDETISELTQKYRIEQHALSGRYVLVNIGSGLSRSFRYLEGAIFTISRIRDFPVIHSIQLESGKVYYGEIEISLDIEALPPPIRPIAYLEKDWRLSSEEKTWPILP